MHRPFKSQYSPRGHPCGQFGNVGRSVGNSEGAVLGCIVGEAIGASEGTADGCREGRYHTGDCIGELEGCGATVVQAVACEPEVVPIGQMIQSTFPKPGAYVPGVQLVHSGFPYGLAVPGGHCKHSLERPQNSPGSQPAGQTYPGNLRLELIFSAVAMCTKWEARSRSHTQPLQLMLLKKKLICWDRLNLVLVQLWSRSVNRR